MASWEPLIEGRGEGGGNTRRAQLNVRPLDPPAARRGRSRCGRERGGGRGVIGRAAAGAGVMAPPRGRRAAGTATIWRRRFGPARSRMRLRRHGRPVRP